jgi:hypothetical protein
LARSKYVIHVTANGGKYSMAKFAPVAPIQVLEQLYEHSPETFGEYHLLLAHHTVQYKDRFKALFERIYRDGRIYPTVIMDNSVVECGGYVDFDMMMTACQAIADNCLLVPVLPDVMGKGPETREASLEAYSRWTREMPCDGFMAVCQGADLQDYHQSLDLFANKTRFGMVSYLGIPRILVHTLGSRHKAVLDAVERTDQHLLHLLGYSDDMQDDLVCSRHPDIEGIDSAVPLRVDGPFSFDIHVAPRPEDWFDQAEVNKNMLMNLQYARSAHESQG